MKTPVKILIVLLVASAAIVAFALKGNKSQAAAGAQEASGSGSNASTEAQPIGAPVNVKLPKLLDLGAGKCIPCKMMKPILDDLKRDYSHVFITEFIDVWENREAGEQYGIEAIPTQIFYDAEGKELFRHTGFYGKEDILGKWKELGVNLAGKPAAEIVRETSVLNKDFL
jgi:thioredoxin 1